MKFDFGKIFLSKGVNYFNDDLPLQAMLRYFDIKTDADMEEMGKYISEEMIETATFVDHYAKPALKTWSILDERIDGVWLSPDHYTVLEKLQELGSVRKSIRSSNLLYHFLSGYLVSDSGIFCTLTLTAQTAYALAKYGKFPESKGYLDHYLDPADPWYGATFYSELQGGSDLGSNNTSARKVNGKWLLNGSDKYFASNAGVADGSITTARIEGDAEGPRGISVFFVPARNKAGGLNYSIRRIKDKMGTIAVPTGEVEMVDSEGYLLGEPGKGIYYALEILTISRIDDAIAATGIARKALWEAYLYANEREAFGKRIIDHPLLLRDFLEMESDLEASLLLSLLTSTEFCDNQKEVPPYGDGYHFARMMTHITKNIASQYGSRITQYCLEVVGGKGFMSEFPLEKFHRDELVTSIWEGTSNMQALDLLEILRKKSTHIMLFERLKNMVSELDSENDRIKLDAALQESRSDVDRMLNSSNPEILGKDVLFLLGEITAAIYLYHIAEKTDSGELNAMADIYFSGHFSGESFSPENLTHSADLRWMSR